MKYLMCFLKGMLVFGMLFLFWEKELHAQQVEVRRSHAISTPSPEPSALPATGTLNVVAIMVEFQPDTTRFTSGTGIFGPGGLPYLENADDIRIEPLPHDQAYFEAHLEFAKNYFEQSSDGQLTIDYRVLPDIYRLDKKMEAYSPTGETFTNEKVAMLARDAWQKVEEKGGFDATGLDPETTAFVIFHAGVGRDIELTGTSLTITPYDIPSLYLRKQELGRLLDDTTFDGFSVNNGDFRVTNSMILPRTESRRGVDVEDEEFVFPLSVNGLLCASIGSHLGLPDLFNTEDGNPAIGRFGLMDGAGFFSYNGLLPPEPSAWEKIYLGWQNPFMIDRNTTGDISLEAASFDSRDNIARYNLSSSEYFLVENRHRDPDGTGVTLTIRKSDGTETTRTFSNMDDAFIFQETDFDTLLPAGVIVDADNFDFSLPGGIDYGEDEEEDTEDDRVLNGGMLIWHIDEAMIQANLENGGVNTNRYRRGVDLEEADGAQDIGPGIPGAINNNAAFGTALDFWWSENDFPVTIDGRDYLLYENRFGPDTRPDNSSNTGAPSYFEFYNFSDNLPVATFNVRPYIPEEGPNLEYDSSFNSELIYNPTGDYYKRYPLALAQIENTDNTSLIIPSAFGNLLYNPDTGIFTTLGSGTAQQPHAGYPLVTVIRSEENQEMTIRKWEQNQDEVWITTGEQTRPANRGFISSENNQTLEIDFSTYGIDLESFNPDPNFRDENIQQSKILNGSYSTATADNVLFFGENLEATGFSPSGNNTIDYSASVELDDGSVGYLIFSGTELILITPERTGKIIHRLATGYFGWPAITDFNQDGSLDFIFADYDENLLYGLNQNSGTLDNFPFIPEEGVRLSGTPLVADLENDGQLDLIIPTQDSLSFNLVILDSNLEPKSYSPLYVGGLSNPDAFSVNPVIAGNHLFAISQEGDLKGWYFENMASPVWPYKYGTNPYNKVTGLLPGSSPAPEAFNILNKDETYNWPNPADDHTNIRFQIAAPGGKVEIKIASLSGRIVFEEQVETYGGTPEEVRVNTSGWGSGGYFAIVKATVDGETESKLIKIGVIH